MARDFSAREWLRAVCSWLLDTAAKGRGARRSVALALADVAEQSGGIWIGSRALADVAGVGRPLAIRIRAELLACGWLTETKDTRNGVNVTHLAIPDGVPIRTGETAEVVTIVTQKQKVRVCPDSGNNTAPVSSDGVPSTGRARAPVFDFAGVYSTYPRKAGKAIGLRECRKRIKTTADFELLRRAVEKMAKLWAGRQAEIQFCPHFSTYIRQERWRDEEQPAPKYRLGPSGGTPDLEQWS